VICLFSILFYFSMSLTGNIVKNNNNEINYTYTKAICNSTNFCQDNVITCKGNKTISIKPITGAVVQHNKDWIDPRENKDRLC
jgi:hypothetical protein